MCSNPTIINVIQSNALCAIKHYVRWPSAPHSHGHHNHHHTSNPFSDCHVKWCVEYQAAIPPPSTPSSSSIILLLILLLIVMQSGLYNTHSVYQAATQAGRDQWTSYQTTSTPTHFDKHSPSHHHHLHRLHHKLFFSQHRIDSDEFNK